MSSDCCCNLYWINAKNIREQYAKKLKIIFYILSKMLFFLTFLFLIILKKCPIILIRKQIKTTEIPNVINNAN